MAPPVCAVPYNPLHMAAISSPIGDLRPAYDVVVIGSGYGGSIAARLMSKKDGEASICVLERGIERQPGQFPDTIPSAIGQFQVDSRLGRVGSRTALFDMRINHDVSVLVGCGLGGTSLINAGVMIEPADYVLRGAEWPRSFREGTATLDFEETKHVLGARPVPIDIALPKAEQLRQAGLRLKDSPEFKAPHVAVSFVSQPNEGGAPPQRRCALCGDCFAGCNHGAKNTADRMFLARANRQRTVVFCGIDVRRIEPDGEGWLLHARFTDRAWRRFGEPELTLRAGAVFLAAGTLGSTEILLRSRARLALSTRLGEEFSGNGDAIAFGYNCVERVDGIGYGRVVPDDAAVGPTIAGMLDDRYTKDQQDKKTDRGRKSGATIQEGAVPGLLSPLLRVFAPIMARATRVPADQSFQISFRHIGRELHSLVRGAHHGALARTQTYLCMSLDDSDGRLGLVKDRLRVSWAGAGKQLPFERISSRLAELTKARGGRYVMNPFWSRLFGRRLLTVHPLGGCGMGDSADRGVVDEFGRVFNTAAAAGAPPTHPHLYVCDGAIIPTALGTNPALTISALAHRIATQAPVPTLRFPLPRAPEPIDPATPGIRYAERLRGRLTLDGQTTRLQLVLHISAEDLEGLLKPGGLHQARIVGMARTPDLPIVRWTISNSTLNVLIDDPRKVDTTLLLYQLRLTSPDGRRCIWLRGHKTLNLATMRRQGVWRTITSFRFAVCDSVSEKPVDVGEDDQLAELCTWVETVTDGGTPVPGRHSGACAGRGAVAGSLADSLRLGASIEIVHEPSAWRRLKGTLRYIHFFGNGVFQARAWLFRKAVPAHPFHRPRVELPPDIHVSLPLKETPPEYRLTKYKLRGTGRQKAVVLAPGFGMAADCFYVGNPSLVEYLCRRHYDVYLLDYRGSDHLPISLTQFTLDELVDDFRRAFERVRQESGAPIRVIGHCVASLVTTMTLLKHDCSGIVQSAILSQTHVFQNHPLVNRLKAWTRLPQLLMVLGFNPVMTSDHDVRSGLGSRMLDVLLRFYPSSERCSSPVCRRILLMYGEVLRHDQFDRRTHAMLYDLFDRSNLTLLSHMALLVRRGHAVDKDGREVYLTAQNGRKLTMPITILQGRLNNLFRPIAAQRTLDWLRKFGPGNPAANQRRFRMLPVARYAHLDHFLGKHAADDVFPTLVQAMDDMDRM